jgi:hypothetical protein
MKPFVFLKITCKHSLPLRSTLGLALLLGLRPADGAGRSGHDHGEAPAAATGTALPRFAATSDLFELVGVLDGQKIALYLDHAGDNSPVKDARLELDIAGTSVPVTRVAEGEFQATLAAPLAEGVSPVTATVVAAGTNPTCWRRRSMCTPPPPTPTRLRPRAGAAHCAWISGAAAAVLALGCRLAPCPHRHPVWQRPARRCRMMPLARHALRAAATLLMAAVLSALPLACPGRPRPRPWRRAARAHRQRPQPPARWQRVSAQTRAAPTGRAHSGGSHRAARQGL